MRPFPAGFLFLALLIPLAASAADSPLSAGDAARGNLLFQQNCRLCHSPGLDPRQQSGQGPLLAGVVGRPAGSLANFGYTKALESSGIIWNAAALDRFLTAPGAMVPGTNMVVIVASPRDRRDLIAFLATLAPLAPPTPRHDAASLPRVSTPGDWQNDRPGARHQTRVADLPAPYATESAGNAPHTVDRPANASLSVPAGFQVKLFAAGLSGPRLLRTAPNGDIFIAETRRGRIRVLRAGDGEERPSDNAIFAAQLHGPFGIAFYPLGPDPRWVYVANLNSVVRFPYRNGDLRARGPAETIVPLLTDGTGGHTTRDVAFSPDGRRMFISIGSGSNVAETMAVKPPDRIRAWEAAHARGSAWSYETRRADIVATDPEGRADLRYYATGLRNAVTIAFQPRFGQLWAATNERDGLGDDLVPDYITHVREGGFYGWPWYYMGNHEDPRHAGERPDLNGQTLTPDVPLQSHSAPLEMMFYPPDASGPAAFPAEYRGDIFAALHGSWNRTGRTGSKLIRVHLKNGVSSGAYEDFMTGFVIDDAHVWGRPVGVAAAHDGALLVTDDANGTLWRISYRGGR